MKRLFIFCFMILPACTQPKIPVDMIVINAKVYTVDDEFNIVESFCIQDGMIVQTGTSREILRKYTSASCLDLQGKYVYPGLIDAHCHFTSYGQSLRNADLVGTKSFEEVIEILKAHHEKVHSYWILGRGWDQNDWDKKEFPDRALLDQAFPDHPVLIIRVDGHAAVVNQKAIDLAGLKPGKTTPGGTVVTHDGRLTGVLIDNAIDLVRKLVPEPAEEEHEHALLQAQDNCFAVGLTSVQDAGLDAASVHRIDSLQQAGRLKMRIYAMLNPTKENIEKYISQGIYKTPFLHVASIKLYADGALGSRGALMIEPYSDDPGNHGLAVTDADELKKYCDMAYQFGYQVNTHCIGDSANRLMLHMYAAILKGPNDRRWRIEHAQVIHPADFPLFDRYSVIPSVQFVHATSDMYWAEARLGKERVKGAYAYKQLMEQNGFIPNGSDFPVESTNPLYGFYAGFARKDLKGYPAGGYQVENALTREQAMRAMTLWAARAAFEEVEKGSLEAGKYADFIITGQDLMTLPEQEVPLVKIEATFVGGTEVFRQK
jgi:predicted amidohydrolase YtcJ